MNDFIEIDFLSIDSSKSGDAITIRYRLNNQETIHVVDGGFEATGDKIINHIKDYYGSNPIINRVVVTHPDHDHARGLRAVLENMEVKELWMLRPWVYSEELIQRFKRWTNTANLTKRLKEIYPNIAALEEIALEKNIPIKEPFQGKYIGEFLVLAPSKGRYLDLVSESEKTPEASFSESSITLSSLWESFRNFIKSAWGEENLSDKATSCENEMSIVQYAEICNTRFLLTGDAGKETLTEALDFLESKFGYLPKINRFQVPHHGSRRNISSEILDRLFGEKLQQPSEDSKFSAIISASKDDKDHPRNAVIRALHHRGATVVKTERSTIQTYAGNAPTRDGWGPAPKVPYPEDQEE